MFVDIGLINNDLRPRLIRCSKRQFLKHPLDDRIEPPRANIFDGEIHRGGRLRLSFYTVLTKADGDIFCAHKR